MIKLYDFTSLDEFEDIRHYILRRLSSLGINKSDLHAYDDKHRYFHNTSHIEMVVKYLIANGHTDDCYFLAAIFHDVVYEPLEKDNEEKSADCLAENWQRTKGLRTDTESVRTLEFAKQMILDTKNHVPSCSASENFIRADLYVLVGSLDQLIEYEHGIFKEYQMVDYKQYKKKRIEILIDLKLLVEKYFPNTENHINELISYVRMRKVRIGVYAGSFSPFHAGHENILKKAEKIFDKVIIAQGINISKSFSELSIPASIVKTHQICKYDGMLHKFISDLGYEVTIVRGLRNEDDFKFQEVQLRFINEFEPKVETVYIIYM